MTKNNRKSTPKKGKVLKKRKVLKRKRVTKKKTYEVATLTIGTVMQNKQVAALPVIPAYDFRILEQTRPSVWDDE